MEALSMMAFDFGDWGGGGSDYYDDWFFGGGGAIGGGSGWGGSGWDGSGWGGSGWDGFGFTSGPSTVSSPGGFSLPGGFQLPNVTIGGGGGGGGYAPPSVSRTLTEIVDSFEQRLQTNLRAFQSGSLSVSGALAEAWRLIDGMVSACIRYGAEGQKAAAERDRRIDPARLRWDWIGYYIDPITGGNTALPPVPGGSMLPQGFDGSNTGLWLVVGLLAALYLLKK